MQLTLEALQANDGDCLLLHYERDTTAPVRILIDGGSRGIYSSVLRRRLDELRADETLDLRMAMVSHIPRITSRASSICFATSSG
jgi:hypothetical protein